MSSRGPYRRHTPEFRIQLCQDIRSGAIGRRDAQEVHPVDQSDSAVARLREGSHYFNANDYNLLIQMVLNDQGVALGWDHLVLPLAEQGRLIRPVEQEVVLEETRHYLAYREDKADDDTLNRFRDWFMGQLGAPAMLRAATPE